MARRGGRSARRNLIRGRDAARRSISLRTDSGSAKRSAGWLRWLGVLDHGAGLHGIGI